MGSQEGYNGKTERIQGKDRKDTRERQEGYKGKRGRTQVEDRWDTSGSYEVYVLLCLLLELR